MDLDRLEQRHLSEEAAESGDSLFDRQRPQRIVLPEGGATPTSEGWLERLYEGDRVVREKKPIVVDHLRSSGPFLVSIDEPPLSVLDGMSQTATFPSGFASDRVVRGYVEGELGDTALYADDTSVRPNPHGERFAELLRRLVPGLPHVSFVNSGAEANEKAYAICMANRKSPRQRRLLAFEGSFHGRTLLSVAASYNPSKRTPYEFRGFEVTYAPFPVWPTPEAAEPVASAELLQAVAAGTLDPALAGEDAVLAAELEVLGRIHRELESGEFFAVVVEPMQSEGGDRYATARFYKALRLLTRHHDVPLIVDEVQTGFGLGGTFAWHHRFELVDAQGRPDTPDCVLFSKRAQVGVVMSRFADPEPTSAHPASLARGRLHAEALARDPIAAPLEAQVRAHLRDLEERFEMVESPRCRGYAFAFDLPDAAHLNAYLAQRFYRGAVVFGAGARTVRYRLSQAFDAASVEQLFKTVEATLRWLEQHRGEEPPEWIDPQPGELGAIPSSDIDAGLQARGIVVRVASADEKDALIEAILELEAKVYEPARRDPAEVLARAFDKDGVAIVAEQRFAAEGVAAPERKLVGVALGAPLEQFSTLPGPDRDPMCGRNTTIYAMTTTVASAQRGIGLGRALKTAQLRAAGALRDEHGEPRYRHLSGRNRVGLADAMTRLARSFGAYEICRLFGQYGDPDAEALYYRLPVGPMRIENEIAREVRAAAANTADATPPSLDLAQGIARPFEQAPESLRRAMEQGGLFGSMVHKLTISNYVTPAIVRALEWVSALSPAHPHLYSTSSRDEALDKSLKIVRLHRSAAQYVLGLQGGYYGHTSAAARSLSDPSTHVQGPAYFDTFERLPHPKLVGTRAALEALEARVAELGAEQVLTLVVEPIGERSGLRLPDDYLAALDAFRSKTGVPIIASETCTAAYRSGCGPFYLSASELVPDLLAWWAGGQQGFIHCNDAYYVPTPLTMISTWDGDELSAIRVHHQLRAARRLDLSSAIAFLDRALEPLAEASVAVGGHGLYRVIDAGDRADAWAQALGDRGIGVRLLPNGRLAVAPPLDLEQAAYERLAAALAEIVV